MYNIKICIELCGFTYVNFIHMINRLSRHASIRLKTTSVQSCVRFFPCALLAFYDTLVQVADPSIPQPCPKTHRGLGKLEENNYLWWTSPLLFWFRTWRVLHLGPFWCTSRDPFWPSSTLLFESWCFGSLLYIKE